MTTAVLFDLEGTLVQTPWEDPQHVLEFRLQTRRKLIQLAISPSLLEGIEPSTLMRNKASEYVEKNFSKADVQAYHKGLAEFLRRYEVEAAENSKLFAETVSTLEELRKGGAKMGLVTNTSREAVEIVFQLHSLKGYFDVVVTREDVKRLKPDPEGILQAVRRLGADGFFMIGDLALDVLAARNADGTSVFVKRSIEGQISVHADHVVRSLKDIPSIVQTAIEDQSWEHWSNVQSRKNRRD
jgi:HAD superfamily hydrolase (TIGR01549 family)